MLRLSDPEFKVMISEFKVMISNSAYVEAMTGSPVHSQPGSPQIVRRSFHRIFPESCVLSVNLIVVCFTF